ncbi:MAG: hypothetical protein SGILL_002981 [Bacillariaceae sp.]
MEAQQQQEGHHRRARSITSLQRLRNTNNNEDNRGPTVLNILVSAYQVRWRTVEERLATHPNEAAILDSGGSSVLFRALTRRIDDYPPARIVRKIVEAHPNAVWARYDIITLLELACERRASLETLEILTSARPAIPEDYSVLSALWKACCEEHGGSEEMLVGFLRSGSAEAFMVGCKFQLLLKYLTTQQIVPLTIERALASSHCSMELFRMIGTAFSQPGSMKYWLSNMVQGDTTVALDATDANGRMPLHLALEAGMVTEQLLSLLSNNFYIAYLISRDPISGLLPFQVAAQKGSSELTIARLSPDAYTQGRLPLHLACCSSKDSWLHEKLLAHYPRALEQVDSSLGLPPVLLAAQNHRASLGSVFYLLTKTPDVVMKRDAMALDVSNNP